MKTFSHVTRALNLKKLDDQEFDLVIIGGGITGAGAARDAAMRGMKVALVEASDFASGTSSRSSKLVHGGIRYLENLEFKLVFEALSERAKLFEMAPHMVHPLRFMIPLFEGGRVGMFKMGLGMWLYDALSLFQAPEMHEALSKSSTLRRQPLLQDKGLLGSFVYSDAYMDDDRLVFETLRSANDFGAVSVNFVKATGAEFCSQTHKVKRVVCKDQLTGQEHKIRTKHVISSVGPWTDQVGKSLDPSWKPILRPTKGVHLTFRKDRLPLNSAVVMGAEARIVFGIPRHEMVIVGTTDTDFSDDPASVTTTPDDVVYLLGVIAQYFPQSQITAKDIVASYAGVRPLVRDGSENEGKTSREHTIFSDPTGITYVAGGKYTTYRLMAQQVVEEALKAFDFEDKMKFRSADTTAPLNPLVTQDHLLEYDSLRQEIRQTTQLCEQEIEWLTDRYGFEALEVLRSYGPNCTYLEYEALHAVDSTMCLRLEDFFTRRVPLILAEQDHGIRYLEQISRVFQSHFSLSTAEIVEQQVKLRELLARELGWKSSFA
jgi:glycerol-3-phosphate dehydrogenase